MTIKSLAVFCGSKLGNNPIYEQHAIDLGYLLASKNITLIYGGGNKGIMGAIANAVLEKNGTAIGIMPKFLGDLEHKHNNLTELIEVEDMHIRKRMLYQKCDAAIILPGGYGTLDELFEMLTWNQLSIHNKKIFILNSGNFYTPLLAHITNMFTEGFLYDNVEDRMKIISTPNELEKYL